MKTAEDEEFERIERQQSPQWVCPFCYNSGCPTPGQCKELAIRNHVIDEIADHIQQFKVFGQNTIDSFTIYIRGMKK